jgi:hypothetical protein
MSGRVIILVVLAAIFVGGSIPAVLLYLLVTSGAVDR